MDEGLYPASRDLLSDLLGRNPGSCTILRSLSLVSTRLNQPKEAMRYALQAVACNPQDADSHFGLAVLYLLHGNYAQGLAEYEWRLLRRGCMSEGYAQGSLIWDGRPLHKDLLVHCEQGLGDSLQFIRFIPLLKERLASIYLACPPELSRLFSRIEGIKAIILPGEKLPAYQWHCPLLSLAHRLNISLTSLSRVSRYLAPAPRGDRSESLPATSRQDRPGPLRRPFRIGLVWRARQGTAQGTYKSIPLPCLRPLASLPVEWISLQRDPGEGERQILDNDFKAVEAGSFVRDFQDTADLVETLDLVVTVDTSVAHLAGGLGTPVWLLLPKWPDWRWLLEREESPWYPAMILFRQTTDRDWSGPVSRLKDRLEALLSRRSPT